MHGRQRDLRLFVAAYPPAEAAIEMLGAARALQLAPHREVPADQVHLTLAFIGSMPARQLDAVRESVARAAAGIRGFTLMPVRLVTLPQGKGSPRLLALETDAPPTMLELVARLVARLVRNPRQRPTDRFLPHLTLARFEHTARAAAIDQAAKIPPFAVDRIHLMQSILRPEGAQHEEVEAYRLG